MNKLKVFAVALFCSAALSACIFIDGRPDWNHDDWRDEQRENREVIANLNLGMSRDTVVDRLGTPAFSEAYSRDGDDYQVLFFRTRHRHSDGDTSRDETTPLVFKNGNLTGWGEEAYASVP